MKTTAQNIREHKHNGLTATHCHTPTIPGVITPCGAMHDKRSSGKDGDELCVAVRPLSLCLCSLIFCAVVFIAYLLHDFHGVDMNLHGCSTAIFDSTTQRNTKSPNKWEKYSPCTPYHSIWRMEWLCLVYLSLSHMMDSLDNLWLFYKPITSIGAHIIYTYAVVTFT